MCVPAIILVGILHALGLVSLENLSLSMHRLAVSLIVNLMLGGYCEELFFREFVRGSLNRAIGYEASLTASGIIFGLSIWLTMLILLLEHSTRTYSLDMGAVVKVLLCCFVGVFFGLFCRKCGDIYCHSLFHGSQDFTTDVMSIFKCPSDIPTMALDVGRVIFLAITYRQFISSKAHR